jgi:hypothetical protein
MRKRLSVVAGLFLIILKAAPYADANQVPSGLNFQGRLTDSHGHSITGTESVTFSIWSAASQGSQLWSESQNVTISSGIYNVALGSVNNLPASVFASSSTWLQVQVAPDAAMTPRIPFRSVPYAMVAETAPSLEYPDGLGSITPVITRISQASPYTVPEGYNFYFRRASGDTDCYGDGNFGCDLTASGIYISNVSPSEEYLVGPLTVLATPSSIITDDLNGFLVSTRVSVILQSLGENASYTVPAGKNFYLRGLGQQLNSEFDVCEVDNPLTVDGVALGIARGDLSFITVVGSGKIITNTCGTAVTLMGYLK